MCGVRAPSREEQLTQPHWLWSLGAAWLSSPSFSSVGSYGDGAQWVPVEISKTPSDLQVGVLSSHPQDDGMPQTQQATLLPSIQDLLHLLLVM